jgi:23S rRNA pseudouridine955/2504/2580 synthase
MELITGENDKGRRLDRILRKALPEYPLPLIHRLLRQKRIFINGKPGKAQDRLECNVKISIPSLSGEIKLKPQSIYTPSLDIIWEGLGLLAVNKPCGLVVHGPCSLDTIVNSYLADKLPPSLSFKPGPLHRLDKPSSGIIVFSTSIEGARIFSSLLHEQKIKKTYLAIIEGILEKEVIWQDSLIRDSQKKKTFVSENGGKNALTKTTPLAVKDNYTLIKAEILTGRTHQIRAQAAANGHPLAGDTKYGGKNTVNGKKTNIFLHAWKLEFLEYKIEAPLPQDFKKKTEELFKAISKNITI